MMKVNTVVHIISGKHEGKKALITDSQYMGTFGVSNHWSGYILDNKGNPTRQKIDGYDNGYLWEECKEKYEVLQRVQFKK